MNANEIVKKINIDHALKDEDWSAQLIEVARQGDKGLAAAKSMIERGADVNYKNNDKMTALIAAVDSDSEEMAKLLLEHGADVKGPYGQTALKRAAELNSEKVAGAARASWRRMKCRI